MLPAQTHRVCAVPGSLTLPIASIDSSVTCAAAICRCRAEDSALRLCRSTLSNQAGLLSALPRCRPNGEIAVDESHQGWVVGVLFEPHHEPVVIDPIKERFHVGVHHSGITCADVRMDLPHGLMRRASGAEPVTAGVEVGFPFCADDLRDGLF